MSFFIMDICLYRTPPPIPVSHASQTLALHIVYDARIALIFHVRAVFKYRPLLNHRITELDVFVLPNVYSASSSKRVKRTRNL